jgi:hypothetical protein
LFYTTHATELTDSIPADPKDVSSPEAIVAAVYDVISGPAGQKRNWDRMRTLFVPDARMIPTGKRPTGEITRRVLAVGDYITSSGPFLEKDGFFETGDRQKDRAIRKHSCMCSAPMKAKELWPMKNLLCGESTVFNFGLMANAGG